jgi:histone acetyltransferase MYST1
LTIAKNNRKVFDYPNNQISTSSHQNAPSENSKTPKRKKSIALSAISRTPTHEEAAEKSVGLSALHLSQNNDNLEEEEKHQNDHSHQDRHSHKDTHSQKDRHSQKDDHVTSEKEESISSGIGNITSLLLNSEYIKYRCTSQCL